MDEPLFRLTNLEKFVSEICRTLVLAFAPEKPKVKDRFL